MKFAENWNNWQFSLTEAKYASGPEISQIVLQNVDEAMIHVFSKKENVAGVILPGFELYKVQGDPNHLIGLVCTFFLNSLQFNSRKFHPGSRWTRSEKGQEKLPKRHPTSSRNRHLANPILRPGRGHQTNESSRQCHKKRDHPKNRENNPLHHQ